MKFEQASKVYEIALDLLTDLQEEHPDEMIEAEKCDSKLFREFQSLNLTMMIATLESYFSLGVYADAISLA